MVRSLGAAAVAIALIGHGVGAHEVAAQARPEIQLDQTTINPGDAVMVTLSGWSGRVVTISVCGNLARRGSTDCNQVASQGIGLNRDGSPTLSDFVVALPPTTCPCVIRASSTTHDAVALVPIELVGAPVGPLVGSPASSPVSVSLGARRASAGLVSSLRSALGGPTGYEITVLVQNRSAETIEGITVTGAARRGSKDVETLEVATSGPLEPGETWEHVARSTLPAPAVGTFRWEITASGGGPAAHAEVATDISPTWLFLLALVLVVDLVAIAWRRMKRRSTPTLPVEPVAIIDLRSADRRTSGLDLRDQPTLPVDDDNVGVDTSSEVTPV